MACFNSLILVLGVSLTIEQAVQAAEPATAAAPAIEATAAPAAAAAALHPWSAAGKGKVDAASFKAWADARLAAVDQHIASVVGVKGPRTLENTLRPYDDAIAELGAAGSQAGLLDSVHPLKEVRDQAQAVTQRVSEAGTLLSLNQDVYRALSAIDLSGADAGTRYYVERTLLEYRLAGVDKDAATRARIKALQDKATELSLTFGRNVQENVNHITIKDKSELDGLPPDYIASHTPAADGAITITTDFPDYMPLMTFAKSDDVRRRMYLAYNTRAFPANKQVLLDLLKTRQQIATILGYSTWADLATADQMMQSASKLKTFLDELNVASRPGAEREFGMVMAFAKQQQPGLTEMDAASRGYWYEQYRRTAFNFDSQSVRPYFPYDRVEKGVLQTAERLFHVTFVQVQDPDVWDPSVTAWNVFDGYSGGKLGEPSTAALGSQIGRFYLDMHPRDGKDKWFSAAPIIPGIRGRQYPEAALICNFPGGKPAAGKPADPGLMQYDNVTTFFHEFGHLMHAILGGQQPYAGTSGITTEGDFVEAPSQMLEEFFRDPKLLATFALHYQTNQPIPAELVARMNHASAFGRADAVRAQLFYSAYSLDTHHQDPDHLDLDALLHDDYMRFLPYKWIDGNRMYSSFTHLVGYTSNYYTYQLDKAIALDFFAQFDPSDLVGGPTAMRYRRTVLEPGGSKSGNDLVKDFLGRPQSLEAYKAWIGEEFAAPPNGHQ
ncbi:MAG TPA: M3 family metallopeptidase [Acidisarcina sp.]